MSVSNSGTGRWGWTGSGYYELATLTVSLVRQDIAGNRSLFRAVIGNDSNNSYGDSGSLRYTLKDQWNTRYNASRGNVTTTTYNQRVTYATTEFWIHHSSDGTMPTIRFNLSMTRGAGNVRSVSINVNLSGVPTIPRASTIIGGSSVYLPDGDVIYTIQSPAPSGTFKHKVEFRVNGTLIRTNSNINSGTHQVGITSSDASKILNMLRNTTRGSYTLTLRTYHGTTQIGGAQSLSGHVYVHDSVKPKITSITITEGNQEVKNTGVDVFLSTKSQFKVSVKASGVYGSTISKIEIRYLDRSYSGSDVTLPVIPDASSISRQVSIIVTDSRGRQDITSQYPKVSLYTPPEIEILNLYRVDSSGREDDNGEYLKMSVRPSFDSHGGKLKHDVSVMYGSSSGKFIKTWDNVTSFNILTFNTKENENSGNPSIFSVDAAHDIFFNISNAFETVSASQMVQSAYALVNFNRSGKGIAFGKVSDKDAFEVAMPSYYMGKEFASGHGLPKFSKSPESSKKTVKQWYDESGEKLTFSNITLSVSESPTGEYIEGILLTSCIRHDEGMGFTVKSTQTLMSSNNDVLVRSGRYVNNPMSHSFSDWYHWEIVHYGGREGTNIMDKYDTPLFVDGVRWEIREMDDGRVEMWGRTSVIEQKFTYQWGSLYTSGNDPIRPRRLPTLRSGDIKQILHYSADIERVSGGDFFVLNSTPATTTHTGKHEIARGTSGNTTKVIVNYYIYASTVTIGVG